MASESGENSFNTGYAPTGMDSIPPVLIASLNKLGLTNDEARVYATLVLFDYAEAKEIVEYLTLSKPSVYKALETLDRRGLALRQKSKPVRYRAISPEMAVSILLKEHESASSQALSELKKLERKNVRTESEEPLWTIYGEANTAHKIQELFRKAKREITLIIGERYLPALDHLPAPAIPLHLTIISSSSDTVEIMQKKFPGPQVRIKVIPISRLTSPPIGVVFPEIGEVWKYLQFENVLELNVDDEELLLNAAFFSRGSSVLNTRNKGAIIQLKILSQLFWNRFADDERK
ncbi:MAG: TrmB family transcriptional regulator [Methanolinea sp.]|nr:TrmB family transcriptional regulator [Methanolinea sp.]